MSRAVRWANHVSWTCIRPTRHSGTGISAGGWRGRRGARVHRRARLGGCHGGLPEERPTPWELDLALPIGAEAIVPYPLEAPGQDMQENVANELCGEDDTNVDFTVALT